MADPDPQHPVASPIEAGAPPHAVAPDNPADPVFLPGSRFVLQLLDLPVEAAPEAVQSAVDLALETHAPFPLGQLARGWHRFPSGRTLAFAAHRRCLPAASGGAWEAADLAAPDFAPGLDQVPASFPTLILWQTPGVVTGILWREAGHPDALSSRDWPDAFGDPSNGENRQRLTAEFLASWGQVALSPRVEALRFDGRCVRRSGGLECLALAAGQELRSTHALRATSGWDVRPPEFLGPFRAQRRRSEWLWRTFAGLSLAAVVLLLGEVTLVGIGRWQAARQAAADAAAPLVKQAEDSLALRDRLASLSAHQLRPFAMLAAVVDILPESTYFESASISGPLEAAIDARTDNPNDVPAYENQLKGSGRFTEIVLKNTQIREGRTSFRIELKFRPEALAPEPSSPR